MTPPRQLMVSRLSRTDKPFFVLDTTDTANSLTQRRSINEH
ncbi:hypothetical protein [Coleofasciculus sp.]